MTRFRITLCGLLLSVVAAYAIPQQINYQGSLTNASGTALDTTVAITFNIWPVPAGGSPDWTETHPSVTVSDGLFHVLLGSVSPPLPDLFTADRWLGITVGGDTEMSPRQQIVSVAHAYRVGTVDGASGGTITSDVIINNRLNVGSGNVNSGLFAFVAGQNDTASGNYATVSGGRSNTASDFYSTVGGGYVNTASGSRATVSGGYNNTASDFYSTVGGGHVNTASGSRATVSGGYNNTASGLYSTVSGGYGNTASNDRATVSGGYANAASNDYATVSGGNDNTASGSASTVPGGYWNVAAGQRSFAAGYRARANHGDSFVWGSSNTGIDSTASFNSHTFTTRCANGARFYTAQTGTATGVQLMAGGGAWSSLSDARQKENFRDVNTQDVLDKVSRLKISEWNYKSQDDNIRHMGPMAQDFYAAFGLGESDTTITTVDPDGVLFAAVQELAKQNAELKRELNELRLQVQAQAAGEQKTVREER